MQRDADRGTADRLERARRQHSPELLDHPSIPTSTLSAAHVTWQCQMRSIRHRLGVGFSEGCVCVCVSECVRPRVAAHGMMQ